MSNQPIIYGDALEAGNPESPFYLPQPVDLPRRNGVYGDHSWPTTIAIIAAVLALAGVVAWTFLT
jgi:hypothetical protein